MSEAAQNVVVGEVSELASAAPFGRVRVRYQHLNGTESGWCPVVSPMTGPGRGFVFMPEVGDHVLVLLEGGDANRGFIVGGVWSEKHKAPEQSGPPADNNVRFIRSRSGHQFRLDDTKSKERIELVDKDGTRKVVIDSAGKKIQVICDSGDVEVTAGSGNVTVKAASGAVTVEGATISIKAKQSLTLEAGGTLKIKGAKVDINPPG
jgi:phage baseplate assembly protein V